MIPLYDSSLVPYKARVTDTTVPAVVNPVVAVNPVPVLAVNPVPALAANPVPVVAVCQTGSLAQIGPLTLGQPYRVLAVYSSPAAS
jgi:hypothetical protein